MRFFPFVSKNDYEELLKKFEAKRNQIFQLEVQQLKLNSKCSEIVKMTQVIISSKHTTLIRVIETNNTVVFVERQLLSDNVIILTLHTFDSGIHYNIARLFASYEITSAFLEDIQCAPCKGYGTILINEFINFCKSHDIHCITGILSSVDLKDEKDSDHATRLIHFYTKHGFTIKENRIKLKL